MSKKNLIGVSILLCIFVINGINAHPINYITLENKFNARMEITDLYVVDLNNDGSKEIIATSYDSKVYLLDSAANKIWQYDAKAYVYSVNAIDMENDGLPEIVAGSSRIHILDFNRTVLRRSQRLDPVKRMVVGDFDLDGFDDIMVSTGRIRSNTVYIFNNKFEILWQKSVRGEFPWGIAMGDLDNDGKKEVIIGGSEILVYDADKNLAWGFKPDGGVGDLLVEDIDDDGKKEVLVGSYSTFYVLTNDGGLKWSYKTKSTVKSIHVTDLEHDGKKEIIIGSDKAYLFDAKGDLIWSFNTSGDVNFVHSGDLNWDDTEEVAVGSKRIYVLGKDGNVQWEYEPYRAAMKLLITDVDNDGRNDLVVGGLDNTVYLFKAREVYIRGIQSYSLYEEAEELYNKGNYSGAKSKIEEAIYIRDRWNIGKCKEDTEKCDSLLQKINEKLPSTTTTTTTTTTLPITTTIEETTTTTLPGGDGTGFIIPAVIIILVAVMIYLIRRR
ncbi:MAG: hypothetical protein DRO89_03390 [Candidatus Altiarchaeales archaeon]|nr:MAG: hypothetical protein DRO89_03390 [Candidatus Altiarchaeales archaeon]